jgi:hypothetical protein
MVNTGRILSIGHAAICARFVASPGGSHGPLVEEYWLNEAQALSA